MIWICWALIWAQESLPLTKVYTWVLERHPLARAIGLGPAIAEAQALSTEGVWDPTLSGNLIEKNFKNQLYYTLFSSELKIPVWNALDLKAIYESTGGFSLNPEDVTPSAGLVGVGLSIPLGQGILIDYRRASIQKARLYALMAPYERQLALAELLLEVAQDYWDWFAAYYKTEVYKTQLGVAQSRLQFLQEALWRGEATRADTLEAYVEVGLRKQALLSSQGDLLKKALLLQRHLWEEGVVIDTFLRRYRPDTTVPLLPLAYWDTLIAQHPKLRLYDYKRKVVEVERKWAVERLRPRLQVDYLFLRDPQTWMKGWERPFATDFKFGLTVAMPLYLREARGSLLEARLRLRQLRWEQEYEARSLYNKVLGQMGVVDSLREQVQLQRFLVEGLFELVRLEQIRFSAGESDLFLINRREREAYAALLALYELYARYGIEVARLRALLVWIE